MQQLPELMPDKPRKGIIRSQLEDPHIQGSFPQIRKIGYIGRCSARAYQLKGAENITSSAPVGQTAPRP